MAFIDVGILAKLFAAAVLGFLIGLERDISRKPAGTRTHALVCLGSCLFTILGLSLADAEIARIMAGIITGIGFLGAGIIFQSKAGEKKGLTTAAGIWAVSGIGIGIGLGEYGIAVVATLIILFLLLPLRILEKKVGVDRD